MRALPLFLVLIIAQPSSGGDFDYGTYKTAQLADVAAGMDFDPRANYWFDAAHAKYHAVVVFTGNTRVVSPGVKTYIEKWVKTMGHPAAYHEMFQHEIEIRQGSFTYWLPIQQQLVAPFGQEVPAGAKVNLYVLLMGALNHVPVFAASEFNAVGG
ncbi:hypothetical protein [Nevskia sp.]|uniref:hypothetical protein n=1 Tax=Nevskia sp. TaxID=1929292 RepID=UPI0025E7040B|nr:hypothetical protein [Nevskia sp.]